MAHEKKQDKQRDQERKSSQYIRQTSFGKGKTSWLRQQFGKSIAMLLVIVVCILFYFALLRASAITKALATVFSVAKPILYGMIIAYLLNPLVKYVEGILLPFLERKCPGMKKKKQTARAAGVFAALIFMIAVIVALLNMLLPELYRSVRDMILNVPSQLNQVAAVFTEMNQKNTTLGQLLENVMEEVTTFLQNWMRIELMPKVNQVMTGLTEGVLTFLREFLNILIGVIVSVYVLYGRERFSRQSKKLVYAFFKPGTANMILHLTIKSNEIFGGFIIGKIIDSAIIGVLCFIGLSILNMPYTLLVSVIVGVTNVIPFFGPYIGAVPSAILILLADPRMGIYFIIFIIALQQFDGNVLGPKILGDSTGLSAFWVIFSILIGGGLFGFPGMILGVPVFAVIYYIVNMIVNSKLERKNLPTDTRSYDELSYVESGGAFVCGKSSGLKEEGEEKHADSSTE